MLFNAINEAKLSYLNALIEYSVKNQSFISEYRRTFWDIEDRTGLRRHDPRDDFHLTMHQRYQMKENYKPILYADEHADALEGKLNFHTSRNKDTYK